mgnify:CR=1 FL=1
MYYYIKGTLAVKAENYIVVDAAGVEIYGSTDGNEYTLIAKEDYPEIIKERVRGKGRERNENYERKS